MPTPVATAGRGTSETDTARQSIEPSECPSPARVSTRDRGTDAICGSLSDALPSIAMQLPTITGTRKLPLANAPFAIVARTAR